MPGDDRSSIPAGGSRDAGEALCGRGWRLYVVAALALAPVVVPRGPAQTALLDLVNLAAAAAFVPVLLFLRLPITLPFAWPVLLISIGSLLAVTQTASLQASLITVLQDAYLYLWLVLLVALLSRRGHLAAACRAWCFTAVTIAIVALAASAFRTHFSLSDLLLTRRDRALGTFCNPNMYADYLVLSGFITLGSLGQVRARYLLPALGVLAVALLSTKSNGGLVSALAGLAVWAAARAWATGASPRRVAGAVAVLLAAALLGGWANAEWRWGEATLRGLGRGSFVGHMAHSTESRQRIWEQLQIAYAQSPLGIGPGSSSSLMVPIGEREREGSLQSKESHSDYLGYAVERGPLALAGLLLLTGQAFVRVLRGRARIASRVGAGQVNAWWPALLGALVATAVHSTVIEKLHFRHFWALMALVVAMTGRGVATGRAEAMSGVSRIDPPRPQPSRRGEEAWSWKSSSAVPASSI